MSHSGHRTKLALIAMAAALVPRLAHAGTCAAGAITYATTSNRIYVTGPVTCTLTDIQTALPDAPLQLVDPTAHVWFLSANLFVRDGAELKLQGSTIGGDVDELRLKSDNSGFVEVRAEWGKLTLQSTKVTSWDEGENGPDTEYTTGRAFVRAVSYVDVDGTPRQSQMDVMDSDVGYLGYYASESYGLVWKVRGTTGDTSVFDVVDVVGSVTNSYIHHNYFGMYTFGAYGMHIADNEVWNNAWYGVDPHDDSDSLVVERNFIHENGNHGFICSQRCDHLEIRDNVSQQNVATGYMVHRGVTDSIIERNVAQDNGDAGFAIMDSHNDTFRNNVSHGNRDGIRLSVGASGNLIEDNDFSGNVQWGVNFYQGTDPPSINDGRPQNNTFQNNDFSNSGEYGVRATDAYANTFVGNLFGGAGTCAISLIDSTDNVFEGNDLGGSYLYVKGPSENEVKDTEVAGAWIDDPAAQIRFDDGDGRVMRNDARVPTQVGVEGGSLTLTSLEAPIPVAVQAVHLAVEPVGGQVLVNVDRWGNGVRSWSTTPAGAKTAAFTVSGLATTGRYTLTVDGVAKGEYTATANQTLTFSNDATAAHTYALVLKVTHDMRQW